MTENHDSSPPAPPAPPTPPLPPAAAAVPSAPRQRWRDRVYGARSVAAVALAGLVLGAGGGTGITLLAQDDDHGDVGRFQRMHGPGDDRFGGHGQPPPGALG